MEHNTNSSTAKRLLPNHVDDLRRSGLSDETISRWGCYSIAADQKWVLSQLGFGHVELPALALPILRLGMTQPNPDDVVIKPDRPRKDDRGRTVKYESKPGSANCLHVPLSCRELLDDTSVPLWITEGSKKAEKAAQEGLCCAGLLGVWNWRNRLASDLSVPLADFDLFPLQREIRLSFDSDWATNPSVRRASRWFGEFLVKRGAEVDRISLPEPSKAGAGKVGLDDFLLIHSVAELEALQREKIAAEPNLESLLQELSPESDSAQVENILRMIATLDSQLDRERNVKQVAERTTFRVTILREEVARFRGEAGSQVSSTRQVAVPESEQEEALDLLKNKNLLQQFRSDVEELGCVGQGAQKIVLKLAAVSGRLSEDPINVTVKGESAGGKNHLLYSVLETEPPEDVIDITRMTSKALQYWPESLRHKIVMITEVPGTEDADYTIRTFQSEKHIRVWVAEKDETGHLVTRQHEVEGPAVFFQTTTKAHLHSENETRNFDVFVDETEEQTKRIFAAQDRAHMKPRPPEARTAILRRWRNAARLLAPVPVLIPFADKITFPTRPLRVRRDRPRVLSLIEASALLHQHQREVVERDGLLFLIASVADYAIARELAVELLEVVLSGATPKCRALIAWAETLGDQKFTKKDLDAGMDWSRKTTLKYLSEAVALGCIGADRGSVKNSTEFSFLKQVKGPLVDLVTPDALMQSGAP